MKSKNVKSNKLSKDDKLGMLYERCALLEQLCDISETRTRGQMVVQHASWYLLAEYHKLDKDNWDAFKILCNAYFKIPKNV